jgi:hypothetical protein
MMRVVQREPSVAKTLQHDEDGEGGKIHRLIAPQDPQGDQPGGMNGDDQRIMRGTDLDRTARLEVLGVGMGKHKLAEPLQRHQRQDD